MMLRSVVLLLLAVCCAAVVVNAAGLDCSHKQSSDEQQTFLWRVEERAGGQPSYLFGTIHVAYNQVWSHVAPAVKLAFERATNVYFELDLADRKTMKTLSRCQLLPNGESLKQQLPSDVYDKLLLHMQFLRRALPIWMQMESQPARADYLFKSITGNWRRRRPIWLLLLLNSLSPSGLQLHGVPVLDLYLAREAQRRRKHVGAVEQPADQCQPLNQLDAKQVVFVLNRTLQRFEADWNKTDAQLRTAQSTGNSTSIVHHYNCGSLTESIFNRESTQVPQLTSDGSISRAQAADAARAASIDVYLRRELIDKRNVRMAARVVELLRADPFSTNFFAFGAGHFLGGNSILQQLEAAGYSVRPVGQFEPWTHYSQQQPQPQRSLWQRQVVLQTSTQVNYNYYYVFHSSARPLAAAPTMMLIAVLVTLFVCVWH